MQMRSVWIPKQYQKPIPFAVVIMLFTGAATLLSGCDDTLKPFKENDRFIFSIYGYLDTSSDQQWIRVINLQEAVDRTGGGINGTVTLEHLETGEKANLEGSLFRYSDIHYAYNFKTDLQILPENTYQLTATREDGSYSSATIDIPRDFRDPFFLVEDNPENPDILWVYDVDNLADIQIRFTVYHPITEVVQPMAVSLIDGARAVGENNHRVFVDKQSILAATRDLEGIEVRNCSLYVASAGSDWIDFSSLDPELIALPDGATNISRGTGFLIGINSRSVLYENFACADQRGGDDDDGPDILGK